MRCIPALVILILHSGFCLSQDTLLLINGKELVADSARFQGYYVDIFKQHPKKTKHLNAYRVFSIRHSSGLEEVIYAKDPSDPLDFSPEEMRLFIKGEQDAERYYVNDVNKGVAFCLGSVSSLATFYGLLIPPLYSSVVGSITPDMNRMKVSDESLRTNDIYCEGYQSTVRKKKIKNSLVAGLVGFAYGAIALSLVLD
ncbi:MAG: hypothetical protein ACKOA1_06140 [Bacteroidota bacterium]